MDGCVPLSKNGMVLVKRWVYASCLPAPPFNLISSPCFSVLTPYYKEDVLYSVEELNKENEDGISILFYLQKIYPGEFYVDCCIVAFFVGNRYKIVDCPLFSAN